MKSLRTIIRVLRKKACLALTAILKLHFSNPIYDATYFNGLNKIEKKYYCKIL